MSLMQSTTSYGPCPGAGSRMSWTWKSIPVSACRSRAMSIIEALMSNPVT